MQWCYTLAVMDDPGESEFFVRWKFFVQPFNIIQLYTIETQGETNIDLEKLWFPYENLVQMLGFPQLCEFRRDFYGHESTPRAV